MVMPPCVTSPHFARACIAGAFFVSWTGSVHTMTASTQLDSGIAWFTTFRKLCSSLLLGCWQYFGPRFEFRRNGSLHPGHPPHLQVIYRSKWRATYKMPIRALYCLLSAGMMATTLVGSASENQESIAKLQQVFSGAIFFTLASAFA